MYLYYAYRLNIHSEISLPCVFSTSETADVTVRIGSIEQGIAECGEQGVLGSIEGIGRCLITGGRQILVEPFEGVSHEMISPNILGGCMAVILRQRGSLVLHASSVSMKEGAVAFLGGSGWGKSTLATALHAEDHRILTDDVMALRLNTNVLEIIPSFPQCKLSPEAAIALGKDLATLTPLFAHAYKLSFVFESGFQAAPLPLKKLYILAKGSEHSITAISPKDAFSHLVSHTRAVATLTTPEVLQKHFIQCTHLLKQVPCYRFIRKPGLSELPNLVRLVTNHANGNTPEQADLSSAHEYAPAPM